MAKKGSEEPKKTQTPSNNQEKSWYLRGADVFARKKQLEAVARAKKERAVGRFFLKAGEEATVIFVDSSPFGIYEHNLRIDGRWGNFYTCCREIMPCPICQQFPENRPAWTAYLTVIDTRSFIRQSDGQLVKNRKILYPAKGSAIVKLEKLLEKHKSLAGLAFKISRLSEQDPNCGSDFELLGRVNIAKKFGEEYTIPIDYDKVLAFPTDEELAMLGIGYTPVVGSDDIEENVTEAIEDLIDEPVKQEVVDVDDLIK